MTFLAGLLAFHSLVGRIDAASKPDVCQATAIGLEHACEQGLRSDYSLELAKCANLSDAAARKDCQAAAAANKRDAMNLCDQQEDIRRAACDRLGGGPYDPVIDPANFVATIDNPYYPLKPGTTFIYEGPTPDGPEHRELSVTHKTRKILGVSCVEVHDVVIINGALEEDTLDWFAQDKDGNVWYFGENSKQIADGLIVGLEGSWTGGVDGAKPGLIMQAHPAVGDFYRQEVSLDTAEDLAEVQSLDESVTVPYGSFSHCQKTLETTPLKPNDVSNKYYCKGVGEVLNRDLPVGERLELKQIIKQ